MSDLEKNILISAFLIEAFVTCLGSFELRNGRYRSINSLSYLFLTMGIQACFSSLLLIFYDDLYLILSLSCSVLITIFFFGAFDASTIVKRVKTLTSRSDR